MPTLHPSTEAALLAVDLRPGERLIRGRVHIFDMDLLNDWMACQAKAVAPSDLTDQTDEQLSYLNGAGLRVFALSRGRDLDLSWAVEAERTRRGQDSMGRPLPRVAA